MHLYVLRHGIAEDASPGGDGARRLTLQGRQRLRREAAGMRRLQLHFDVILTSPLVRAVETAAIVCEGMGGTPTPHELAALATGVAPVETARALAAYEECRHVLVVGHEPGLSSLVSLLLTGSADALALVLKKGGLVALEMAGLPPRAEAVLRWALTPRQLRALG